jgi:B12 binding domain
MQETRVLLVFPGSLYGGRWADGPRVKPELVQLFTELRRAGYETDVLDLEAELGNPADDVARESFLQIADGLIAEHEADLVVISCWSALQYSAAVAVAERVRRQLPDAVIAACGHHVSVRPDDFNDPDAPFDWLVAGEAETAVVTLAAQVAAGERETGTCHSLEGTPLPLDAQHLPDYAAYPYAAEGLPELGLFLSRGCPYNAPACLLRPGGAGWHAYPPDTAVAAVDAVAALHPDRVLVLDPAFGYDPGWRRAVLDLLAAGDRRDLALSVTGRPYALERLDVDRLYRARAGLVLEVGTLSPALLGRTGEAPYPRKAVAHALALLEYLNAKGVVTRARFEFNQPGETEETAAETLDALERFADAAPNTTVTIDAQAWAYLPISEDEADAEAPASRFGTRIEHREWWKEHVDAHAAATAVVASTELMGHVPGDESYWRPRFEKLRHTLAAKLTADARRGLRSHETVGSAAYGVPHGWWTEPRWH